MCIRDRQKVVIAREVTNDKDLLIAVNPTRGLDVGAIEFVHKYLVCLLYTSVYMAVLPVLKKAGLFMKIK